MASQVKTKAETLDLRTIYRELATVKYKWFQIGIRLGLPHHKLKEFEKEEDSFAAVIDYWLKGNVEDVPLTWKSIVRALQSDEKGLAARLSQKYCQGEKDDDSLVREAVGTSIASSGSTTFDLPPIDKALYFPYMRDNDLTDEQLWSLCAQLDSHTEALKSAFASVVYELQSHIKNSQKMDDLINIIKFCGIEISFSGCSTIVHIFERLIPHFSFFDFKIIKLLTKKLGSEDNKLKLKQYKKMFKEYCKCRVCECPTDAFGDIKDSEKLFFIKTDKHIQKLKMKELITLKNEICKVLKLQSRLLRVEDDYVKLNLRVSELKELSISDYQQSALRKLGVLSISYGGREITGQSGEEMTAADRRQSYLENIAALQKVEDLIDHRYDMLVQADLKPKELTEFSPLYVAIQDGNLELVRQLAYNNENPMSTDANGDSCLHFAVRCGQFEILKYLIEKIECPPGTKGWLGTTILDIAALNQQYSMVKYLIENKKCNLDPASLDDSNMCALHYACHGGDLKIVRFLIKCMKTEHMTEGDILYDISASYANFDASNKVDTNDFMRSPLCCACYSGHLSVVKYLVEECKCDISLPQGKKQRLPIESAIMGDRLNVVKYLVNTPNFLVPEEHKNNFLHLAVQEGSIEMVEYLAQTLKCNFLHRHIDKFAPLHVASMCGKLDIVDYLLTTLKCDPSNLGEGGYQPIHYAASSGHVDVVEYLVRRHYVSATVLADNKISPLDMASYYGHMEVVEFLTLECDCDPSVSILHAVIGRQIDLVRFFVEFCKCDPNVKTGDFGIDTPLGIAADMGNIEMVKVLVEKLGADPMIADDMKRNALHHAVRRGHFSVTKYLVESGKCRISDTSLSVDDRNDKITILDIAAGVGHLEILKYLLEEVKMKFNQISDSISFTPLHHAALHGQLEVVKYIMEHPEFSKMYSYNSTELPLHWAIIKGHLNILRFFLEEMHCSPYVSDKNGNTLLHTAAEYGQLEIAEYLSHSELFTNIQLQADPWEFMIFGMDNFTRHLMERLKMDPNVSNSYGFKPIHLAAECGHLNLVKYFIEDLQCRPDTPSNNDNLPGYGAQPIHCAAKHGRLSIVQYLVEEQDCDPSSRRDSNITPLHDACFEGHLDVAKYLIFECKVDPFCRLHPTGPTPMHFAAANNRLEIVQFLTKEFPLYPLVPTFYKRTPLYVALQNHSDATALFLMTAMYKLLSEGLWSTL